MGEIDNSQEKVSMPEVRHIFQGYRAGLRQRTLIFSVWMTIPNCHCLCEHSVTALHFLLFHNYNSISLLALSPLSNFYFWIRTLRRKMVYGIIFPSFWLFPCKINHSQKSDFFFSCWLPPFSLCSSPAMLPGSMTVSPLPLLLPSRTKSKPTQSVHHSQGHIW